MFDLYFGSHTGEYRGSFHRILQLTNIARKAVRDERMISLVGDAFWRKACCFTESVEQSLSDRQNIIGPFAKSGNAQVNYIQAMIQISPERTVCDLALKIGTRCGDHTNVYLDSL